MEKKRKIDDCDAPHVVGQGDEKFGKVVVDSYSREIIENIIRRGGLIELVPPFNQFNDFAHPPPEGAVICVQILNQHRAPSLIVGRYSQNGLTNMLPPDDYIIVEESGGQAAPFLLAPTQPINLATARWIDAAHIIEPTRVRRGGYVRSRVRRRKRRVKSRRRRR